MAQNMIAWVETSGPAIDHRIADLDRLDLPEAAFDLVYSALTLH
ncbi:class I SAM-dependent methyltransferase [Paenirhodobacter sp.]